MNQDYEKHARGNESLRDAMDGQLDEKKHQSTESDNTSDSEYNEDAETQ